MNAQNESFKNVVSTGVVPVCFILMYKNFNNGAVLHVLLRNCGRKSMNSMNHLSWCSNSAFRDKLLQVEMRFK